MDRVTLGNYIRDERIRQGISIRKMAELSDVQPATVQNLENGTFSPRLDIVQRMLAALGKQLTVE